MGFNRRPGKNQPRTIIKGIPDCIHFERIDGYIGTCRKCGRVVQYPDFMDLSEQIFSAARYDKENAYGMYVTW